MRRRSGGDEPVRRRRTEAGDRERPARRDRPADDGADRASGVRPRRREAAADRRPETRRRGTDGGPRRRRARRDDPDRDVHDGVATVGDGVPENEPDAEQYDAEQHDAEQHDAEQHDAEQYDAEQYDDADDSTEDDSTGDDSTEDNSTEDDWTEDDPADEYPDDRTPEGDDPEEDTVDPHEDLVDEDRVDEDRVDDEPEPRADPPPRRRIGARAAARAAVEQIAEMTGRAPEGVTFVRKQEDSWMVGVEVVETERIPDSSDVLAVYEAELDDEAELMSYQRVRRYPRGRGDDD